MLKKAVLMLAFGTFLTSNLHATSSVPKVSLNLPKTWECSLQFDVNAKGTSILGMGDGQSFNGKGNFTCRHGNLFDDSQATEQVRITTEEQLNEVSQKVEKDNSLKIAVQIPVDITARSSLDLGFGYFQLNGFSKQWSSVDKLDYVLGVYTVTSLAGSFLLGTGGFTAVKTDSQGLAFQLGVGATRGFGFRYGLSQIEVTLHK